MTNLQDILKTAYIESQAGKPTAAIVRSPGTEKYAILDKIYVPNTIFEIQAVTVLITLQKLYHEH